MEGIDINNNTGISDIDLSGEKTSENNLIRAYELYSAGQVQEAVNILENDQLSATSSYAMVVLGNCYKKLSQNAQAMKYWKKAVEISPLESAAYINIANELFSEGDIHKAILNWHYACSISPENPVINLNLAVAYDKLGYRIKATTYFEKYLKYNPNKKSTEYLKIKKGISFLTAKADFYLKKAEEYRLEKDIKKVAAVYLMLISTYANLPTIYLNIANIFKFDKNYEKALEFFRIVYLNFPYAATTLLDLANMHYILGQFSYAYCYYKRSFEYFHEGTSHWTQIKVKLAELSHVLRNQEILDMHMQKAKEAEDTNQYEVAVDEYENYLLLTESESEEIQQLIDKYKIFMKPEPFVVKMLYNQIPELMRAKKLHATVEVCDRILILAEPHTKEMIYALKCKAECRNVIIAREQFGA